MIILFATSSPVLAQAPEGGFCIANATDTSYIFITETRESVRQVEKIGPGGMLCASQTAAKDGIVSVFESLDALEGCARIIPRGVVETLIAYAEFDRCAWSSHGS
ncbi:MAG: hypothetical protein HKN27_11600 [Silicimonas sp.]|nr:hypothetical protein [Silicimonas sp.]